MNQFETEVMEGLFKKREYEVVPFSERADFYIINTCSVTSLGEKKSRQLIRRAQRLNEKAIIAVTGCYAQLSPEEIKKIEGVRVVIGTKSAAVSSNWWNRQPRRTASSTRSRISCRRRV